jgi:hypothetical protein
MCVHGGTKKGESHANVDVYFQSKAKAFGDKTRFAEMETFRLDLVTLKVGCFAIHISMKILAYLSTCMLMGYCH